MGWRSIRLVAFVAVAGCGPAHKPAHQPQAATRTSAPPPSHPEKAPEGVTQAKPEAEALIVRAPSHADSYDRHQWKHWDDADHDCQDTRQEVLIEESLVPVTFKSPKHCKVATGEWRCPYTGEIVTDPRKLDIDHLVPLKNAYMSGGYGWSAAEREAYANDLEDADHLIAVSASANRQKGAKGPEDWLPSNQAFLCEYVESWVRVKRHWHLSVSRAEHDAIQRVLAGCKPGTP